MIYFTILIWFGQIYCSTCAYTSIPQMHANPCENANKNVLIEHFFNTIFTEFYSSPPVCVCVQMCVGQSTYCYPNGCLKTALHDENQATETTQTPIMQKNKNNFMLLKGERDFMTDFLEKNYVDESKEPPRTHNPVEDMRPDVFKKKYSFVAKHKSPPNVNLKHSIHEMIKKDIFKTDGADWTKIRWPLSAQNWKHGRKSYVGIEKPLKTQGTYFAAMLHDNEVVEYPPKYFKRDLTKTGDDDEGNVKSFYHLENLLNLTDDKSFSLETLIDNLIRSSFGPNKETTTNVAIAKRDDVEIESKIITEKVSNASVNSTGLANETTSVISMNRTNENVERNKYLDESQIKKANNLNEMITILANRIELVNNTSMEVARRTIKNFDEKTLKANFDPALNSTTESTETNSTSIETVSEQVLTTEITTKIDLEPETTTFPEVKVTKKNRQKVVKKASSKMNNPEINLKF